ncbi:MAG TPA: type II 3-dehydroquinate dehydratase [Candidatus Baltobacteraceae bacterium]|nr:type II 3-dehydroquinate dehydratase [Candidatus Baltobacteraceae bacterium]
MNVLVVNGPNLNLLGEREPAIYGDTTLRQIEDAVRARARQLRLRVRFFQSNAEGAIVDELQRRRRWADGVLLNAGAYTHYSYAIRDAIAAIALPVVEVHISNVEAREEFRRLSVIREVCIERCHGRGMQSYLDALDVLVQRARQP